MKHIRKRWIHILIWLLMILYLTISPNIIDQIMITEGKPIQYSVVSLEPSDIIRYSVDRLDSITINGQNIFNIWGWSFITTDKEQANYEIFLVLESNKIKYYFLTKSYERAELQTAFKDVDIVLQNSGFKANIAKETLKSGTYNIGILYRNKISGDTYYQITNAQLLKTPNNLKLLK